eukprot:tig00021127_g18730.t1
MVKSSKKRRAAKDRAAVEDGVEIPSKPAKAAKRAEKNAMDMTADDEWQTGPVLGSELERAAEAAAAAASGEGAGGLSAGMLNPGGVDPNAAPKPKSGMSVASSSFQSRGFGYPMKKLKVKAKTRKQILREQRNKDRGIALNEKVSIKMLKKNKKLEAREKAKNLYS